MKKIPVLPTVIVFLLTILLAVGCETDTQQIELAIEDYNFDRVTIFVKLVVDENGKNALEIYDSNDPTRVINNHVALVMPGTKVVWRRTKDSGIKKFKRIYPKDRGEIMEEEATTFLLKKRFRYNVPDNSMETLAQEEYYIEIKGNSGNEATLIDPYLKFPPPN